VKATTGGTKLGGAGRSNVAGFSGGVAGVGQRKVRPMRQ
jgi:hypothetical protein